MIDANPISTNGGWTARVAPRVLELAVKAAKTDGGGQQLDLHPFDHGRIDLKHSVGKVLARVVTTSGDPKDQSVVITVQGADGNERARFCAPRTELESVNLENHPGPIATLVGQMMKDFQKLFPDGVIVNTAEAA